MRSPGGAAGPRPALLWTGLVLCLAAGQVALLWQRFYYGNDDLLQFQVAQRAGLSWEMLSLNVFQHFAPYNRLGHLLVEQTGLSPFAGLALMTVNLVALLLCALWFMAELGLSPARRLVALVVIGLSVTISESGIWFDTSMHILAALAVTLAICAAHVRAVRTGSGRWHAVTFVLFVAGQLFQERPIFALPLAVLADVLLLWRTVPWRERWQRLWAIRRPLAALVAAAAVIAVLLEVYVVQGSGRTPSWETTGRTMLLALTDYLLPSLGNQPAARPSSLAVQLAVLAATIGAGAVLAWLRRGNAGLVLFAAAAFLLYYGFLKVSPILVDTPASIARNAERLHYAVYVLVFAVIALAGLRGPRRSTASPVRRRVPGRARRPLAVLGIVVLAGYLLVAANAYLGRQWADTTQARAYLDAVRSHAAEWSDPDVTLVPLFVHRAMSTSWSRSLGRQDRVLPFLVHGFTPQDLGPDPVIIDSAGAVRPAQLIPLRGRNVVSSGACGAGRRAGSAPVRAESHVGVARTPAYLVLSYRAPSDATVEIVTDPGRTAGAGFWQVTLPAGSHTRVLPLEALEVRDLVVTGTGSLCISRLSIARVAAVGDHGVCRYVDRYGRPAARATCR